jgi:hypothetical protein
MLLFVESFVGTDLLPTAVLRLAAGLNDGTTQFEEVLT